MHKAEVLQNIRKHEDTGSCIYWIQGSACQANPRIDLNTRLLINRIYRQQEYLDKAPENLTGDFLNQREIFDPNKVRENYILFHMLIGYL